MICFHLVYTVYWTAVAQEESEGLGYCRSVLAQETEPLTAPDEQVGAFSSLPLLQVNVMHLVKLFG